MFQICNKDNFLNLNILIKHKIIFYQKYKVLMYFKSILNLNLKKETFFEGFSF